MSFSGYCSGAENNKELIEQAINLVKDKKKYKWMFNLVFEDGEN